jgi:hypothetical protein
LTVNWPNLDRVAAGRWTPRAAMAAIATSIALMFALGIEDPHVGARVIMPSPPWPPWSFHVREPLAIWSITLWLIELLAGVGLILALLAARHGWRPRPRWLMLGAVLAVAARGGSDQGIGAVPPRGSAFALWACRHCQRGSSIVVSTRLSGPNHLLAEDMERISLPSSGPGT